MYKIATNLVYSFYKKNSIQDMAARLCTGCSANVMVSPPFPGSARCGGHQQRRTTIPTLAAKSGGFPFNSV